MIFRYKIKFISDIEQKIRKLLVNIAVTPFVGVWIEIKIGLLLCDYLHSHSLRGSVDWNRDTEIPKMIWAEVTPFVGVWIEII